MKTRPTPKHRVPFDFVLEELDSLSPMTKPMFGCFIVYIGEKMMLFLRDLEKEPELNGVWMATTPEAFESLAEEFSSARSYELNKIGKSPWLVLPAATADFEEQAIKACELILKGDPRIGREPKPMKARPSAKRKPGTSGKGNNRRFGETGPEKTPPRSNEETKKRRRGEK